MMHRILKPPVYLSFCTCIHIRWASYMGGWLAEGCFLDAERNFASWIGSILQGFRVCFLINYASKDKTFVIAIPF